MSVKDGLNVAQTITATFEMYLDDDGDLVGVRRSVSTDDGEGWCPEAVMLTLTDFMRDLLTGEVDRHVEAATEFPAGVVLFPTVGEA